MRRRLMGALALVLVLLPGCAFTPADLKLDVTWVAGSYGGRPLTGIFVKLPLRAPRFHAGAAGIAVVELLPYPSGVALGIVVGSPWAAASPSSA